MDINFTRAFAWTVGEEGGYTDHPKDRGNWTSGEIGVGELRGTKYGISARAYPLLDIKSLTLDDARAIYFRDYWEKTGAAALPPLLGLFLFDAAVNHGLGRVGPWLKEAIRAGQRVGALVADGVVGPRTDAAFRGSAQVVNAACAEFLSQRVRFFIVSIPGAQAETFGLGWARRVVRLAALIEAEGPEASP